MNNDRFKFRVYDKSTSAYVKSPMAIFDDGSLWNYNGYEIDYELSSDLYIIERCTGLKDSNGRLIYEGDVLEYTFSEGSKRQWFMVFDENLLQFSQCLISGDKTFPFSGINKEIALKKEIVGNIHEPKWGIESEVKG